MSILGVNLFWQWNWLSIGGLVLLSLTYSHFLFWGHRARPAERLVRWLYLAWFMSGLLISVLFLLTPIDTVARNQLFLLHMFQVVFLITFATPCFIYACPPWFFTPLLEKPFTRVIFVSLTKPVVASILFNATFLLWHLPVFYDKTLHNQNLYQIMLWSIFLTSFLNWWPLIGHAREVHRLSYPGQLLYAFLDGQIIEIYALIIVFSGVVLYPYSVPVALQFGQYGDQAAAGALLLVPGIVDVVVMSVAFFKWLPQLEEKARRDDEIRAARRETEEARELAELAALEEP
jgi:putative membrane protein